MHLEGVAAADLPEIWPKVCGLVKSALPADPVLYEPEDVRDQIERLNAQLWVVKDGGSIVAAIVTEIVSYPRLKVLRIWAAAGSRLEEWNAGTQAVLGLFGKAHGCTHFEAFGRIGWLRLAKGKAMGRIMMAEI